MLSQTKFAMMATFLILSLTTSGVIATVDPCTGHYLGNKPSGSYIASVSVKSSSDIQAAECSHNTRMSGQLFAWFEIDASKAANHGAPYGTCFATASAPPSSGQLETNSSYDVFFWKNGGGDSGTGTGPIRDPQTGEIGWEDNSGTFKLGASPGTDA